MSMQLGNVVNVLICSMCQSEYKAYCIPSECLWQLSAFPGIHCMNCVSKSQLGLL